jgi:hypothetical protein
MSILETFEMIADYADNEALVYSLFRDENEKGGAQWCVRFQLTGANGPYSATYDIPANLGRGLACRSILRRRLNRCIFLAGQKQKKKKPVDRSVFSKLARSVSHLSPSHTNPHKFHEDKSEIETALRRLANGQANGYAL